MKGNKKRSCNIAEEKTMDEERSAGNCNSEDAGIIEGLRTEIEALREMLAGSEEECARLMRADSIKARWEEQNTERRSTFFTGLGFGLTLSIFFYLAFSRALKWIGICDEFTIRIGCWIIIEALAFVVTMYHLWLAKAVDRLIRFILDEADDDMVNRSMSIDRRCRAERARFRAENQEIKCNGKE